MLLAAPHFVVAAQLRYHLLRDADVLLMQLKQLIGRVVVEVGFAQPPYQLPLGGAALVPGNVRLGRGHLRARLARTGSWEGLSQPEHERVGLFQIIGAGQRYGPLFVLELGIRQSTRRGGALGGSPRTRARLGEHRRARECVLCNPLQSRLAFELVVERELVACIFVRLRVRAERDQPHGCLEYIE
ncbi:MAG: hypothetical protein JWN48_1860 [Myxococcaceae bacterium]|nr:hypothetical protein [Myxococcaceae bacterium]